MKRLAPLLLLMLLAGCYQPGELPSLVDRLAFARTGGTLFANPELLTLKEIHLDTGTLNGREIIIEGKVADVSDHATYLVLTDDAARMLVVLTDVESAGPLIAAEKPKMMKILGTVESGKKGLPYIKARSVSVVKDAAVAAGGKA